MSEQEGWVYAEDGECTLHFWKKWHVHDSRHLNLRGKRWCQVGINHVCCIRRSNLSFR